MKFDLRQRTSCHATLQYPSFILWRRSDREGTRKLQHNLR